MNVLVVVVVVVVSESSINGGTESCLTIEALDALGFIIAGKMGNRLIFIYIVLELKVTSV